MQKSEDLPEIEWDNYPLDCCEAFLAQVSRLPTASPGLRLYFILPEIDKILDRYNAWHAICGD